MNNNDYIQLLMDFQEYEDEIINDYIEMKGGLKK